MKSNKQTVVIGGQTLDINSLEDSMIMQSLLLPKGFEGDKNARADAVRLFLNLRNMAAAEFDRHLTHNYKKMLRTAGVLVDDQEKPVIPFSFKCEFDLTVPTVAAIGKTKMSVGGGFSSEGKAKTHDINQGDLFEDETSLDPGALDREDEADREREAQEQREADEAKAARDAEKAKVGENVVSLPGAASETVKQPKAKAAKKKVAKKGKK